MRIFLHSYGANEHLNIEVHQSIKKKNTGSGLCRARGVIVDGPICVLPHLGLFTRKHPLIILDITQPVAPCSV